MAGVEAREERLVVVSFTHRLCQVIYIERGNEADCYFLRFSVWNFLYIFCSNEIC